METANERILESTRQICNLYHDYIKLEEAVKLMRGQNICAEFVKGIYNQLSADADNLTEESSVATISIFYRISYRNKKFCPYRISYREKKIFPISYRYRIEQTKISRYIAIYCLYGILKNFALKVVFLTV
jgi:hypothetical protein